MLEKLKAEVLLAYQELGRSGLNKYARSTVSAIDRKRGLIVVKSGWDALVVDMQGQVLEGTQTPSFDIQSHIAIYQAFPALGAVVQPDARFAAIFAQVGMDIPAPGLFHKDCAQVKIPCAASDAENGNTFRDRSIDLLQTPAALVVSHSPYACGKTALDAVTNAATLEETTTMAYHTMRLDPAIQPVQ